MGGVLGAALTWRVLLVSAAAAAAREAVHRQLKIWRVGPSVIETVLLIVSELVEGARRHQASAVFMELAYPGGLVALAFRSDSASTNRASEDRAIRLAAHDLQASRRCATTLTVLNVPGQGSAMITRVGQGEGTSA
ncbi:hypothetical protein ACF08N_37510 [Streptomyces sp. NPDC015127]|uniref:hypothetical protein n=1 Tax=Streptomyces sp. NPDC015127 TaxID=3364939 RepID=UPI0036FDAF87